MPLPDFEDTGDLPVGVHQATLQEVIERFGTGTARRRAVTERLLRIYDLANATQKLQRFIIFGSYVTDKPAPNDVDIILVMQDNFSVAAIDAETQQVLTTSVRTESSGPASSGHGLPSSFSKRSMRSSPTGRSSAIKRGAASWRSQSDS